MKKITLLVFIVFIVTTVSGQTWCGNSYITVNGTWYTGSNSYVQPAGYFQGATLGSFDTNSGFTLGGELQVYPQMSTDATLYYSIDSGSFSAISLPNNGTAGNNSKHYGESAINFTGLTTGTHSISIYFQAGSASVFDNNTGSNFVASFVISSVATSLNQPKTNFKIFTQTGQIKVQFDGVAKIELFTINGQLIRSASVVDEFSQKVENGAYLLRVNGLTKKVMVQ